MHLVRFPRACELANLVDISPTVTDERRAGRGLGVRSFSADHKEIIYLSGD